MLARHFRQFQKKETSYQAKALIKEEVNLNKILKRILVGEMWVISKEFWMLAPKLWAVLKKVLINKREKESLNKSTHVMINILCLTDGLLMNNRYWGFFPMTQWLAALCISLMYNQSAPHIVVEASLYFSCS